jgi:hypothetical protein
MKSYVGVYFDGDTFVDDRDGERLAKQLGSVYSVMSDKEWHTIPELAYVLRAPEASISARLRDLRKKKFGGHIVEREYVVRGLWKYRVAV